VTLNRNVHFVEIVKITNVLEECAASLFQFGFHMKCLLGQSNFSPEQEGGRKFLQNISNFHYLYTVRCSEDFAVNI
jgi:hypothetical protein